MVDYREILRQASQQNSQRRIAASVHCSRHTVSDVLSAAVEKDIRWPLENDISNDELEGILFPQKRQASTRYAEPDYAAIHKELAKPGVTMTLLWEEYRVKCYENGQTPYQSTQFGEKYRRWARVTKATMRIQHKPGDAMEVDWAGDTIPVFDPVTGEEDTSYLFIAVLPCSCMVYAEPCLDMKAENWLLCHVHAYNYFGGVTRLLIPDNCKTATVSNPAAYQQIKYALAALIANPEKIAFFPICDPNAHEYYAENFDAVITRPELQLRQSEWIALRRQLDKAHQIKSFELLYEPEKMENNYEQFSKNTDRQYKLWNRADRRKERLIGQTVFFSFHKGTCYEYHHAIIREGQSVLAGVWR